MTSDKEEAFMWTQNFNFKLNVYTNEHSRSMRGVAGPNWLREGGGVSWFIQSVRFGSEPK
jgi:hypothetical protein